MMGKNYDAAVLAAGHCGFGLGTDTDSDCQYAGDYRSFRSIARGILGGADGGRVLIDIVNALVIKLFCCCRCLVDKSERCATGRRGFSRFALRLTGRRSCAVWVVARVRRLRRNPGIPSSCPGALLPGLLRNRATGLCGLRVVAG
jgi:hypothetical protein